MNSKILIIDNHTKHIDELDRSVDFPHKIISKEIFDKNLDVSEYDLVILSGGSGIPSVLNNPDVYKKEIELIRTSNIPIIGICLGAEIIAYAFGSKLKWLERKMKGDIAITISDKHVATALGTKEIFVQEAHAIAIETLSPELCECGYSEHGIEIFRHAHKPIIGLQFHPEINNRDFLNKIINLVLLEK